jgi:putative DNA primase/helicase
MDAITTYVVHLGESEETTAMLRSITDIVPVDLVSIPLQLRNLARWVLWMPLPQDDDPGVLTKSPFNCRFPSQRASSTQAATWSDFAAAAVAYEARQMNGAGGLMVALGEGLAGVDIDDAIDSATGLPTPEAQRIIDRLQSYTEVSVSGTGVRIFIHAPEAAGRKYGKIEIYSKSRFLTVTGRHITGTPHTIEERSAECAALRDELERVRRAGRPAVTLTSPDIARLRKMFPGVTSLGVRDEEIVMRASEVCGERFDKLWAGDDSDYESRSQADLALAGDLAFICGPGEGERVEELMRQSALVRPKWDRDDYLPQRTIPRVFEGREDFYRWEMLSGFKGRRLHAVTVTTAEETPASAASDHSQDVAANGWRERPTIILGPETDSILAEMEYHLAHTMFQRAGQLVEVLGDDEGGGDSSCRRRASAPFIAAVSIEQVQRLMSRHLRFVDSSPGVAESSDATRDQGLPREIEEGGKSTRRRKTVQKSAPKHLAQIFAKCGSWKNIPRLNGLMASPFMRLDGTIVNEPGYDPVSGYLLLDCGMPRVVVSETPTADDVAQAVRLLRDLVSDFPFARPEHFSAWLAALLTAAARPAIDGPVPMLWIDANRRGTGKSKLGRLIGIITAGGKPTELSWTSDEQEMESRIASLLGGGDNYAVFDNASGTIRNSVLERFLTSHAFDYRRFHRQELVKMPNRTVLAITGNNLTLRGDLGRRVVRCRLLTKMECPETRDGFRHSDLDAYTEANQSELLAAALTILRAHAVAGFAACTVRVTNEDGTVTELPARPVGSFNEWDRIVRHAILRAGLADPMVTQDEAREEDEDDVKLAALLFAWHQRSPHNPWTVNELLEDVFGSEGERKLPAAAEMLAAAIREITDTAPGKMPEPRTLGFRLRDARDKAVGGFRLRRVKKSKSGVRYTVECEDPVCVTCRQRLGQSEG